MTGSSCVFRPIVLDAEFFTQSQTTRTVYLSGAGLLGDMQPAPVAGRYRKIAVSIQKQPTIRLTAFLIWVGLAQAKPNINPLRTVESVLVPGSATQ